MQFLRNATRAPFAMALAMLAIISGVRGVIEPGSLPLVLVLGWVGYIWAVVYFCGGALMLAGMGTMRPKFEAAGCVLFAGGAIVQAIVTAFFLGASPFITIWAVISLTIFGLAGLLRAKHLISGEQLVWVRTRG